MARARASVGKSTRNFKFASQRDFTQATAASMASIIRNFSNFLSTVEKVTPTILYNAVEPTFKISQKYVPKDTHDLENSGYIKATGHFVEVGYARAGKPFYAVYVHEKVENRHKAPTKAKFLQHALEEDLPNIKIRIKNGYGGLVK